MTGCNGYLFKSFNKSNSDNCVLQSLHLGYHIPIKCHKKLVMCEITLLLKIMSVPNVNDVTKNISGKDEVHDQRTI